MLEVLKTLVRIIGAPFRWIESILKRVAPFGWLEKGMPLKGKILVAVLVVVIVAGGGYVSFQFYDYTQNDPSFCVSCHIMKGAFETWEASVHQDINCHECHTLSPQEMNSLLVSFVFKRPSEVPDRHGKIIVPWKYCLKCHWEKNEEYADAPMINDSRLHAKHYFMEQVECSKCHGYITHEFVPEARFCMKCHQEKIVHGAGMEEIACLNCHTDRTPDLRPGRSKCLYCHGNDAVREKLETDGTLDVTHYKPDDETVEQATKIDLPEGAPMQFNCYTCHKPHQTDRPDWKNCIDCHNKELDIGKHSLHINNLGMECKSCHKPHGWTVTEEVARKDCTSCHEYKSPKQFLGGG